MRAPPRGAGPEADASPLPSAGDDRGGTGTAVAPASEPPVPTAPGDPPAGVAPAAAPDAAGPVARPVRSEGPAVEDGPVVASPWAPPPDPLDLPWGRVRQGPGDRLFARGTGLLLAGSLLGGALIVARDVAFVAMSVDLRRAATQPQDGFLGDGFLAELTALVIAPSQVLLAVPGAMVSAGAYQRGRWAGWYTSDGLPPNAVMRRRARLGWALVGAGAAMYVGQFVAMAVWISGEGLDGQSFVGIHMGLSLAGTALLVPGLSLGPYASGVLKGRARRAAAGLTVAPSFTRGGPMVTLGGRF